MVPRTPFGNDLASAYGIYILAFDIPYCHLYVGIAAFDGEKPEGILTRIKKHRVKATGAHVGANPLSCGGVNHTGGWRTFATARAQHFLAAGKSDVLSDARLIVGRIHHLPDHSLNPDQTKSDLEAYEREICRNVKILDEIKKRLWPNGCSHFSLITKKTNSRVRVGEIVLNFWEKQSEMNMGKISAKIISGADSDMNFRFAKLLEDVSKTWQARDIALVQDLVSHSEYGEAMECLLAVGNNGKGFTKGQSATLVEICKALGVEIPPTKPAPSRPSVLPPIDLTS